MTLVGALIVWTLFLPAKIWYWFSETSDWLKWKFEFILRFSTLNDCSWCLSAKVANENYNKYRQGYKVRDILYFL
jgi:hypothetical protein